MKRLPLRSSLAAIAVAVLLAAAAGIFFGHSGRDRTIRVGLYENAPKIYVDDNGRPAGLFVELIDEIARLEGWRLTYVRCSWASCLAQLEQGKIDLMPDVAFSLDRARLYAFHAVSVASQWSQIYSSPRHRVMTIADLVGKRIALLRGGIQQDLFAQMMASGPYFYHPILVDSLHEGYEAVASGRADVVASNSFFAAFNGSRYGLQ